MDKYVIHGGKPLYGEVIISSAKNAALAIIPAALLADGVCRIENVPEISDVTLLFNILCEMGADIKMVNSTTIDIDCTGVSFCEAPYDLMRKFRSSYYLLGAMLGRFGHAKVSMPGGCDFGVRPIDQHIKGFSAMGADIEVENGLINADTHGSGMHGAHIFFDVPSVGATINVMLAAAKAKGRTIIEHAAREPHVVDLANFLNSMGADIRGAGTSVIKVNGVPELHGGFYSIIPDQIEAGTYLAAVAGVGGEVLLKNVIPKHLECITIKLIEMGVEIEEKGDAVLVKRVDPLRKTNIKATFYPGFPTDMQPQLSAVLTLAEGTSIITEEVWPDRFRYVSQLQRMGASIQVNGGVAVIEGVAKLTGCNIKACDLRAGAALTIAGLCAHGRTEVEDIFHVERGYEDFVTKLRSLGADIVKVSEYRPGEETYKENLA